MREITQMANDAVRRVNGDPVRLREIADQLMSEAAGRSISVQFGAAMLAREIRERAAVKATEMAALGPSTSEPLVRSGMTNS